MDRELIKNINKGNIEENITKIKNIHTVKGDDTVLHFWNSSNNQSVHTDEALSNILDEYLDGETSGSVSDGWNEIMFEIE